MIRRVLRCLTQLCEAVTANYRAAAFDWPRWSRPWIFFGLAGRAALPETASLAAPLFHHLTRSQLMGSSEPRPRVGVFEMWHTLGVLLRRLRGRTR